MLVSQYRDKPKVIPEQTRSCLTPDWDGNTEGSSTASQHRAERPFLGSVVSDKIFLMNE